MKKNPDARPYKDRAEAPPLASILRRRARQVPISQIAREFGCDRRTVYYAINRAAERGDLPPLLVPLLFPDQPRPVRRLFRVIAQAHREGVDVDGWEDSQRTRINRRDMLAGKVTPLVLEALEEKLGSWTTRLGMERAPVDCQS